MSRHFYDDFLQGVHRTATSASTFIDSIDLITPSTSTKTITVLMTDPSSSTASSRTIVDLTNVSDPVDGLRKDIAGVCKLYDHWGEDHVLNIETT